MRRPHVLRRDPVVPPEVLEQLALKPRERVLASAGVQTGGRLVASTHRIHRLPTSGPGEALPWYEIATAAWDGHEQRIDGVDPVVRWRLQLVEPHRLPETIRERVSASVLATRTVQLPSGMVQVAARRDDSGALVLQVVPGLGMDPAEAASSGAVQAALAELRSVVG